MSKHDDLQNVGRHGRLDLNFRRRENRTVLSDSFSKTPMQAFQPFYLDRTGCAYTYIINPTGGLVGGDTIDVKIALDDRAHAFITSPSATKVYRSAGSSSSQDVEITVKRNGILEYMPGYVIPFADSLYRQKMRLCMEEGSAAFILDCLTTGRVAMGEELRFGEYRSITEIQYCGELVLSERVFLKPDKFDYGGLGFFESFAVMAVIYLIFDKPSIEKTLIDDIQKTMEDARDVFGGVSTLSSKGVIVRILGKGIRFIDTAIFEICTVARRHVIDVDCMPPLSIGGL